MATFENPAARESFHSDKLSINITQDFVQTQTANNNPNDVCIDTTGINSRRSTLTPRDQRHSLVVSPSRELNGHVQVTKDSESTDEDDDIEETRCMRCTDRTHGALCRFLGRHSEKVKYLAWAVSAILFAIYFVYACVTSVKGALALIILTFIVLLVVLALVVHRNFGEEISAKCWDPCSTKFTKFWRYFRW